MRGILALIQQSSSHFDHHQLHLRLYQRCNMGRAAMTSQTDPEFRTRSFSSGAAVQGSRPKRKSATANKISETLERPQPAAAAAAAATHEQTPSRPRKKAPSDYWESAGQGAVTASVDDPRTPDQPSEKRIRRRNVRLARTETVTASIPQQVAAVASLPTQSGAHTFEEAPVAVWSKELMQEAMNKLSAADPLLAPLIQEHGAPDRLLPTATDSAFHALAHVIMGQQLSVIAARNIAQKVKTACGGHEQLQAAAVLEVPGPELLACGLSKQKQAYITDLAQRFHTGTLETRSIVAMGDEELYEVLTAVKGIEAPIQESDAGRWSVDMFAMFHCGRLDILPVGDLGVRKGFQALYKLKAIPTDEQMEQIAEKWRPYRSLGSYFMWRVPTQNLVKGKPGGAKKKSAGNTSAVPNTG